jgi:cyclic beta-1,2-glucan synthetase
MTELLQSVALLIRKPDGFADEKPFQAEFFSVERLEQFAQSLAAQHKTVTRKGRAQLLPRLEDNGRKLEASYKALVQALREGRAISPAAEWLVDNYHIVEEQLREIRQDLPKSYYHELPKLAEGDFEGYPRIYSVALSLIAHTDSRLDTNTLQRFIAAYQRVAPLSIGELWAVAITLRLALVENLRRLAITIVRARAQREEADKLADKLLELASLQPTAVMSVLNERIGKREELPQTFLVQLVQRLREQHPSVMPVMDWIEKNHTNEGASLEQIIHSEHQRQAAAQVTVGNIITSMRLLSTLDWNDFFERVSLIEPVLGKDPAAVYLQMEFASRDRYRHVIERISKRTRASELEIAEAAVDLAEQASEPGPERHVGYPASIRPSWERVRSRRRRRRSSWPAGRCRTST